MKTNLFLFVLCMNFCWLFALNSNSQTISSIIKSETQKENPGDKPLKIIKKFHPKSFKCQQSSGTTVLKITFDKSAEVTNVEIIKSSNCESFDRATIKAAKATKFEPALKNNKPVTVMQSAQYNFSKK